MNRPMALLFGGVALVLLYILSGGPACYLVSRGALSQKFVDTVYAPVAPLERHSKVYAGYLHWCRFTLAGKEAI